MASERVNMVSEITWIKVKLSLPKQENAASQHKNDHWRSIWLSVHSSCCFSVTLNILLSSRGDHINSFQFCILFSQNLPEKAPQTLSRKALNQ